MIKMTSFLSFNLKNKSSAFPVVAWTKDKESFKFIYQFVQLSLKWAQFISYLFNKKQLSIRMQIERSKARCQIKRITWGASQKEG